MCEDAGSGAHVDADFCARRKSRIAARRRRGPGCSPGSGWVNEWEGGREKGWGGSGPAVGLRRIPGYGRCLELPTSAAWMPPLPKAQIRGAGGVGGGARSLRGSIHTAAQAGPGSAHRSSGAPSQWG